MNATWNTISQTFTVFFIFVAVLLITIWVTKWIAGYQKQQFHQKNLEVIETLRISQNKYIQIIRVGKTYMAIGIGKDSISMLGEVKEEELTFIEEKEISIENFQEVLKRVKRKKDSQDENERDKDREKTDEMR